MVIKKYILALFSVSLFSCKTLVDSENVDAKIYYFEQENITSIKMIDCSELVSDSTLGLRRLDSMPNRLIKRIKVEIDKKFSSQYIPDVRYRIEIDGNVVCLDYNGRFITKDNFSGEIDFMSEIEAFVRKNNDFSTAIGPSIMLPDIK